MRDRPRWTADAWIGVGYFALATTAILCSRFDRGLAFLWPPSALLIAILIARPRRTWAPAVLWSAVGGAVATGLFGMGWAMAPFGVVANSAEALVAAYLLRRAHSGLIGFGSYKWLTALAWAAGIAGPLAMALIIALPLWITGGLDPSTTIFRVVLGHGLSNMTFIPIIKLFFSGGQKQWRNQATLSLTKVASLFAIQMAVTIIVFGQQSFPLLFLPILPIVAIVFSGTSRQSALSLFLLSVIGITLTMFGRGPVQLINIGRGLELQFLQLYLLATVLTIVPIAAQMRSRARLVQRVKDSEARYRMLSDHSHDIISHTDLDGRALFVSPSISRFIGFESSALVGRKILELIDPRDHALAQARYTEAIRARGEAVSFEYRALGKDGKTHWFESVCRGVLGADDKVESLVSVVRDVSDRKSREDELETAAMTDSLTGLANRRTFREAVTKQCFERRVHKTSIALLDIDHFKLVNDEHGHDIGDRVLQGFALIAQKSLRGGDLLARVGGEEFAILFPGLDCAGAARVCERIRASVAATKFPALAGPLQITISGGVTSLESDGMEAALKRADTALYVAKAAGRDRMALAA
ncbi:MAG: diguanylate cyclase [Pseudomonadota bacterium]